MSRRCRRAVIMDSRWTVLIFHLVVILAQLVMVLISQTVLEKAVWLVAVCVWLFTAWRAWING